MHSNQKHWVVYYSSNHS